MQKIASLVNVDEDISRVDVFVVGKHRGMIMQMCGRYTAYAEIDPEELDAAYDAAYNGKYSLEVLENTYIDYDDETGDEKYYTSFPITTEEIPEVDGKIVYGWDYNHARMRQPPYLIVYFDLENYLTSLEEVE